MPCQGVLKSCLTIASNGLSRKKYMNQVNNGRFLDMLRFLGCLGFLVVAD
ncbi:MAG: hypothetical protein AAGA75_14830 [Cyanobacteria bacterium P01_E01_bin.6]